MAKRYITESGSALTDKEMLFLNALRSGLAPAPAAAKAGYSSPSSAARTLLARPVIQDKVAFIQAELSEGMQVSRYKVFQMLKEAYEMAMLKEEAASMIRVASEINKMCGYYAKEQSQLETAQQLEQATADDPFDGLDVAKLEKLADFGEN